MIRPATMRTLFVIAAWAIIIAMVSGCEVRRIEAVRTDGSWFKYTRTTFLGASTTEGVSVSKDGDDFTAAVSATGSTSEAQQMGEIIGAAVKAAAMP